jgi:N-acyl homoserine lactone hydrolase
VKSRITRLLLGGFEAPPSVASGELVVVNAWMIRHLEATVLVDTGIGEHIPDEDVASMKFVRRPVPDALGELGLATRDVDLVINCHLHADHAGGNVHFRGTRILVQPAELDAARQPDYTVAADVDLDGGSYEPREGEYEPLPGIRIVPTPGHSPGHQAVAIDTDAGLLLLAGQCFRDASSFARALTAHRLAGEGFEHAPETPVWLPRFLDLDPYRVAFGHDLAVWQRDA